MEFGVIDLFIPNSNTRGSHREQLSLNPNVEIVKEEMFVSVDSSTDCDSYFFGTPVT